eukprot:CAMPEP_0170086966 /NCGR_PEP_ID=MMETSP0019_2-20121128/21543_1 /TAXON_ID=98059 /ORGANISM="Dinobryon sp., Strain UTEXLB2267" /LENGTH=143 /DNA_ID=CAMNT_0010304343 /DNA_START=100 /DNA_END=528 /DNA_ORIENTATION=+
MDDVDFQNLVTANTSPQVLSWADFMHLGTIPQPPSTTKHTQTTHLQPSEVEPTEQPPAQQLMGEESRDLEGLLSSRREAILPGNCAAIIHTSGTTGPPKSVMLSHDNTWTVDAALSHFPALTAGKYPLPASLACGRSDAGYPS